MNYRTEHLQYEKGGTIDALNATDIEFYNQGTTIATVNGRVIPPGTAWSINGFPGELNKGIYRLTFVGNTGSMCVTRRVYDKIDRARANK